MGYPHAATHASGTVSKPGASCYDFWFPVSCEKYSPPHPPVIHSYTHTHKYTHVLHRLSHTKQSRAGGVLAALEVQSVHANNPGERCCVKYNYSPTWIRDLIQCVCVFLTVYHSQ